MGGMKDEKNRLRIADCEIENLQGIKGETEKDEARGRMQDPVIVETGLKPVSTLGDKLLLLQKTKLIQLLEYSNRQAICTLSLQTRKMKIQ